MSEVKISASLVKSLREKTGAGMMDCKKALLECSGNEAKAIDFLRTKGLADAGKKSGRIASEGIVSSYIHMGGKIGVLLEVNCETDFVARTDRFQEFVRDVAMQIAAASPDYLNSDEVPVDVIERERKLFREQALEDGKPEKIVDKIVDGRVSKYYKEVCLLEQLYIKDDKKTVGDMVKEVISETGENVQIRRFMRYVLGEGLEKRQDDLAAEVAAAVNG